MDAMLQNINSTKKYVENVIFVMVASSSCSLRTDRPKILGKFALDKIVKLLESLAAKAIGQPITILQCECISLFLQIKESLRRGR